MKGVPSERRQALRRHDTDDHGIVSTRVRPGHRAKLIDVSAGGALIETTHRLLPGASVELHVETRSHRTNVRGRVLRCAIVLVRPSWVCYRGAIVFDRQLPWLADELDRLGDATVRSGVPVRAAATPEVI
jgi:PilZ domain